MLGFLHVGELRRWRLGGGLSQRLWLRRRSGLGFGRLRRLLEVEAREVVVQAGEDVAQVVVRRRIRGLRGLVRRRFGLLGCRVEAQLVFDAGEEVVAVDD